jgi:hypothetical protein
MLFAVRDGMIELATYAIFTRTGRRSGGTQGAAVQRLQNDFLL